MRAARIEELHHLPFVRHTVDPALAVGAWTGGDGAVLVLAGRPMDDGVRLAATAFGSAADLEPMLARVAHHEERPVRLLVTAGSEDAVPAAWDFRPGPRWHWMLTREEPPATPDREVVEVTDADEIDDLLDREAPDSFARPGTPGVEAWLGIRSRAGRLVAVGALVRQPDGSGHLRAVTVDSGSRGRGLGRRLSTALTRRAVRGPGVSSLGVYTDNEPALRIYRDLGYAVAHTLVGGPVSPRTMTTAAAPSR